MNLKTKKRLVVVGIRRKGERGFKIKTDGSFDVPSKDDLLGSVINTLPKSIATVTVL